MVCIPDVITYANFDEDRLRGLGVAGGQKLPFSIDFDRRPCNTLALPCECVIIIKNELIIVIESGALCKVIECSETLKTEDDRNWIDDKESFEFSCECRQRR